MSDATAARPAGLFRSVLGSYLPQALAIGTFLALALQKGVPALRHDWWMSSHASGLIAQAIAGLSTWRTQGLGNPTIYPADYLFYVVVFVLAHLFAPVVVLGIVLLGTALLLAAAARTLPNAARNPTLIAAATFVLIFNPWTYTELVAGHLTMLVSYAGTAYAVAEAAKGRRASSFRLSLAVLAIAQQLQFLLLFLIGGAGFWAATGLWQPFAVGALLGAPVWIGVALGYRELLQIPYTLAWERNQSLAPIAALRLGGYFTHYDAALGRLASFGSALLALLAAASALAVRTRAALFVALTIVAFFLIVTGVNGPAGAPYQFVVTHVTATGVFRELYDLVAYLAIGYVLLVAIASARTAWAPALLALAGAALFASWWIGPPARYWVAASALPAVTPDAAPNSRFAMLPAFQPLRFRDQGSGADPDAFDRPDGVTPLNEYLPAYPAVTAFAQYLAGGTTAAMRALSVSEIIARPWLCTDAASLGAQTSSRVSRRGVCAPGVPARRLRFTPELTVQPHFSIGTLDASVGSGNVLLADALRAGAIRPLDARTIVPSAQRSSVDASSDWVDARLYFASQAELGQPYGGVYTRSSQPLPVVSGDVALALVKGALIGLPGDVYLARTAPGYRWISIPPRVRAVRCIGACAVAAEAASTFGYPLEPPPNEFAPVAGRPVLPWLWRARLPALNAGELVRLNVAYTRYWRIVGSHASLQHVRVDGAVNGWIARRGDGPAGVYLIETRSAALQLAELFVTLGLAAWGIAAALRNRTAKRPVR